MKFKVSPESFRDCAALSRTLCRARGPATSPFKDDTAVGWMITKYDAFGRPVYTGWNNQTCTSAARKSLQGNQNNASVLFETKQTSGTIDNIQAYYSNNIEPKNLKLLTVNYYDDYVYPNAPAIPTVIEDQFILSNTKTLATGSWVRAVSTDLSIAGETSTTIYDDKARPVRTYVQNHLGGYLLSDSKLDFAGKTLYTITRHKRTSGSAELVIREEFTYSPQDRLLTHTHQINGGIVQLMASNTYDELGQLESKNVGNSTGNPFQKIDYKYNIRGWLTGINEVGNLQQNLDPEDLFAFKINYDKIQNTNPNVVSLYNGNIAETFWKTAADRSLRSYAYQYDNLNRLKDAYYGKPNDIFPNSGAYNESVSYDKNGNIKFLQRYGDSDAPSIVFKIDDLTYGYENENSNKLAKVTESTAGNDNSGFIDGNKTGDDYSYDDNGNMTGDKNKNITAITYNHLNLPKKITFGTGNSIEYIYNAAGQKLEKIVTQATLATTTDYLGGFQYKNNVLEFFPTAEGYVKNTDGALSYVFQYKDHLGNLRVSYAKNPQTQVLEIIDENNYYPFGLKHEKYNVFSATSNMFKYNGKELQDELNLNVYDYGARNYDPALGRWLNIDPKGEKYYNLGPYNYVANNPLVNVDPDGKDIIFVVQGQNGVQDKYFVYKKGNFYNSDAKGNFIGKRYNPGKESISPTMYKVLTAYRKIESSKNSKLINALHNLVNSPRQHYVREGETNVTTGKGVPEDVDSKGGLGKIGSLIDYNFSKEELAYDESSGVDFTIFEIVVHELGHAYNKDIGNQKDDTGKHNQDNPEEQRAVFFENLARQEENKEKKWRELRHKYGAEIPKEKLTNPPNNRY
jgi:RHS repeat-associated protein